MPKPPPTPKSTRNSMFHSMGCLRRATKRCPASVNPANCHWSLNGTSQLVLEVNSNVPHPEDAGIDLIKRGVAGPHVRMRHPRTPLAPPEKKACSSGSDGVFRPALAHPKRTWNAWFQEVWDRFNALASNTALWYWMIGTFGATNHAPVSGSNSALSPTFSAILCAIIPAQCACTSICPCHSSPPH